MIDIRNFIAGEFVTTEKTFEKRRPIDSSAIGVVHEAGQPEVDAAVAAARAALHGPWGEISVNECTVSARTRPARSSPTPRRRRTVLSCYEKAEIEGAEIVTGGGIPDMPAELAGGAWVQPTIWTGLPETAAVVTEEIFGPCCHIQPFDTEEEAVQMANNTRNGLATSIYTSDLGRANRLATKIEVGLCWINSWFLRGLRTAFGGSKQSGIGREGGEHSLEFYT